jgi:glycosyltransferase involved in cell wall biosynthesis
MTLADQLTAMILTFNEEHNIARTLDALHWVKQILIVDSGSTDSTLAIVARYPTARVVTRKFDTAAKQCNFGLSHVSTDWVLSMDADYVATAKLASEIMALASDPETAGYWVGFNYLVYGKALRANLYPKRCVLYRRSAAAYEDHGHTQRVVIDGHIGRLLGKFDHDDRKPLTRWFSSQLRYANREADYLLDKPPSSLRWAERIRLIGWPAPILVFFYTLLWKRCVLDGWSGWLYVLQRTVAETMIALELVDRRLRHLLKDNGGQ